jgi:hypothetical protein
MAYNIQLIAHEVFRKFKPLVRLTAYGRRQFSGREWSGGQLLGLSRDGLLRVRPFGVKSVGSYHPDFWEVDRNAK